MAFPLRNVGIILIVVGLLLFLFISLLLGVFALIVGVFMIITSRCEYGSRFPTEPTFEHVAQIGIRALC